MSRRAILALSAAMSAFVLVLAGAAATYVWRTPPAASPIPPAADNGPLAPQPPEPPPVQPHVERRHHERDDEGRRARHERKHEDHEDDDG